MTTNNTQASAANANKAIDNMETRTVNDAIVDDTASKVKTRHRLVASPSSTAVAVMSAACR